MTTFFEWWSTRADLIIQTDKIKDKFYFFLLKKQSSILYPKNENWHLHSYSYTTDLDV